MDINRHNYESWFLDHSDGLLSAEQVAEVLLFLETNPDLKEEFELLDQNITIPTDDVYSFSKDSLKHVLDKGQEDEELIISYLENDLSIKERKALEIRLKADLSLKSKFDQFKRLKLIPAESELDKLDLKKISKAGYEMFFAAYHEGGLNELQKNEAEVFVSEHPELREEFNLYSNLLLAPDLSLIYLNKLGLKKKKGLVIQLYGWVSVAAAAVILFLFFFPNKEFPEIIKDQAAMVHPLIEEELVAEDHSLIDPEAVREGAVTIEEELKPIEIFPLVVKEPVKKKKLFPKVKEKKETLSPEELIVENDGGSTQEIPVQTDPQYENGGEGIENFEESVSDDDVFIAQHEQESEGLNELIVSVEGDELSSTNFHVLDLVEKAGDRTKYFDFESNHKSSDPVRETKFSIGKFSISRKTKRKSRS